VHSWKERKSMKMLSDYQLPVENKFKINKSTKEFQENLSI